MPERCAICLPPHHRDPFDRLLVAQAIDALACLITADGKVASYADFVTIVVPVRSS